MTSEATGAPWEQPHHDAGPCSQQSLAFLVLTEGRRSEAARDFAALVHDRDFAALVRAGLRCAHAFAALVHAGDFAALVHAGEFAALVLGRRFVGGWGREFVKSVKAAAKSLGHSRNAECPAANVVMSGRLHLVDGGLGAGERDDSVVLGPGAPDGDAEGGCEGA